MNGDATILIVDDELPNRKLLETLLHPEGYRTHAVANGEQALASVAQCAPDLILLDVMMPCMDGYQVARTLKADPSTANIPIVMITALIDRSSRLEGLNAGVEEFLTKPVDRAELWLRVRNLLRLKTLGDALRDHSSLLEQQVRARTASLEKSNEQLREQIRQREAAQHELRLAQKLEAVGHLAAGIAHEINTPVQYVGDSVQFLKSAFADMLDIVKTSDATLYSMDTDLDFLRVEVPAAIERVIEGLQRVTSIVHAMKEFAHSGGPGKQAADLNRALKATLQIARAEYRHVATIDLRCGDIPEVLCNVGELSQAFLNLIVNAAHALADSGRNSASGWIKICTTFVDNSVELTFEDNGCGIPEDLVAKIYDPFFTTKEIGRGSGQGLAITRTIVVDKHGGSIGVVSSPSIGTCFTLRLPVSSTAMESLA
jgi:two-component system, NtrC family, sensor kinase